MRRLLHLFLFLLSFPIAGFSADFYWRGAGTGAWGQASNWSLSPTAYVSTPVPPGPADIVHFVTPAVMAGPIGPPTLRGGGIINITSTVTVLEVVAEVGASISVFQTAPMELLGAGGTNNWGMELLATNVSWFVSADLNNRGGHRQTRGMILLGINTTHYIHGNLLLGSAGYNPSFTMQPGNTLVLGGNIRILDGAGFIASDDTELRLEKEVATNTTINIDDNPGTATGTLLATVFNFVVNNGLHSTGNDIVSLTDGSVLEVRNNLVLSSGAVRTPGAAVTPGTLRVRGNISSFGNLSTANSNARLVLVGEFDQTIHLVGDDKDNWDGPIEISKDPGGSTVTLLDSLILDQNGQIMTFTNGIVNTTSSTPLVFIGSAANPAIAVDFSDASHVNGPVVKNGASFFTFPIGNGSVVAPLRISGAATSSTNVGGGAATSYTAQYFRANPTTAGMPATSVTAPLENVSECEYWSLVKNGGSNARVWLSYESARSCGITSPVDLRVANWPTGASAWANRGGANESISGFNFVGSTTPALQPPANYPFFTLGSINEELNPLPVNWLNFTGRYFEGKVDLNWETAIEKDNDVYSVERSATGHSFDVIGTVPGKGNTTIRSSYAFTDASPLDGENYYRIRQTDFDGTFTYSKVIRVIAANGAAAGLRLYPNPVVSSQQLTLENTTLRNKKVTLSLVSATGAIVRQEQVTFGSDSRLKVNISNLKKGSYFIRITDGDKKLVSPVIVQ